MADIFLSHSSADNDAADKIKAWLERDRASWSVFLDKSDRDGIQAGQDWQDRLRQELQSCRLVLAIITDNWLASRWCFTEAVTANFRGKDFVGVLPGALSEEALKAAPPIVHTRQQGKVDLDTGEGWDALLLALDRSGLDPNQWFSIPEGVPPYPGFVAFEEKDAGVFFGRGQEITLYLGAIKELRERDQAQALVISGGSGTGKSSLLKAGLIPRLRRQPDWLVFKAFDPSRDPIRAMFASLRAGAEAVGAAIDLPSRPPETSQDLADCLQDALWNIEEKSESWLLLPIDQAEVLLADTGSAGGEAGQGAQAEGARLLGAIGQILESRKRKLIAVFTIRTEFLPALQRAVPPAVLKDQSLRPITALAEVIEKPAERFGIELERGLSGQMVEDTSGAEALPLLAYTLRELYDRFGSDKRLELQEYQDLGGVTGAIETKLHNALDDLKPGPEELAAFRRAFVRQLVKVDEGAVEGERYLRRAVPRDALPDGASRLIDRLRDARLLVDGEDGTIAIAHERLIEDWRDMPLRRWLAEDSGDRQLIENLRSRHADHRDGGPLLSQKPLRDAEDLLARDPSLEADEPELVTFIRSSTKEEQQVAKAERDRLEREAEDARKITRRTQIGAGVAACLALVAAGVGYIAYQNAQEAATQRDAAFLSAQEAEKQRDLAQAALEETEIANSRRLAGLSEEATAAGDVERGILIALEALPHAVAGTETDADTPEAEQALAKAIYAFHEPTVLQGQGKYVGIADFGSDGQEVLTAARDGNVRIWDTVSGKDLVVFEGSGREIESAQRSPDGARVVIGTQDGTCAPLGCRDRPGSRAASRASDTGLRGELRP